MTHKAYVFYDDTGVIYRYTTGNSDHEPGDMFMEVPIEDQVNYFHHYVLNGEILPRPHLNLQVTQNPFRVEAIPPGTLVTFPGGEVEVNDGFIEWSSVEPGEYVFRFENPPYFEETVIAHITDV